MRVHLFIPCLVDQLFPDTGMAAARLLQRVGCEVIYLPEQTCCGQPFYNSGYFNQARRLAERFLRLFHDAEYVVAPSGSCVSMVKNNYQYLKLQETSRQIYEQLKERVFELSQFLVDVLGITDFGCVYEGKVTYHDSCHLNGELGVSLQPRRLLRQVKGLDLVEMEEPDRCCGFGGTFAVKQPELSSAMVAEKVQQALKTGVEVLVGCDDSCLLNIMGYVRRKGYSLKVQHLAVFLEKCMK